MITIFNRKEICNTYSMEEQARVRDVLAVNGIDYTIKVVDKLSSSAIPDTNRGMMGGMQRSKCQYLIYVKKADFDMAVHLIHKR